jgi:replication factor C subunit 2/4
MADADSSVDTSTQKITVHDLEEIAGVFPRSESNRLYEVLQKGATSNYNKLAAEVSNITAEGYAANEVLLSLYNKITFDELVDTKKKYKLTQLFSEFDRRLVDGVDEQLTVLDLCCQIANVLVAK